MRFRIVCGLVLLLAHAASGAQETVPERVMTFSGKGGSAFADFTLEEGEAALIQFLDEAGEVLHPLSIKVEGNGDSYIAGRVSPGARLDFLPKRNPVSVPLFDLFGLQDMKLRLLVKANAGRGAATIAASTETDIAVVHLAGELVAEMVEIPRGRFYMGDWRGRGGDANELPVHGVTVPSFRIGKHEVTFSQWDACVADGGCSHTPGDSGFGRGNRPVINVSWDDIQEFIAWLNRKTGGSYRLPTESEWEYAARAGSETLYSWGSDIGVNRANCRDCGSEWDNTETAPVGSFPANVWGLHDIHGNVWEWTEDCWNDNYTGAPDDGSAWSSGICSHRVVRGGSWNWSPGDLRSSNRVSATRLFRSAVLGFRLASIDVARQVAELEEEMVEIPGGTFRMGDLSGDGDDDARPVHSVTVPSFRIGKHEVTFSQWDACVADGGCSHSPGDSGFGRGNRPVINVSWDDIQEFIAWLNARTGGGYRLPTESEWEYAARAGSESLYSWGDEIGVNRANCNDCGGPWDGRERTAPVGSFPANAWGLHDMHGNVWEWTEDCWNDNYTGAPDDGSAWSSGICSHRVVRGGSWINSPGGLRSSNRSRHGRSNRVSHGILGFRVARDRDTNTEIAIDMVVAELEEEMVEIPGGTFRMGGLSLSEDDDDYYRYYTELPVHSVTVPSFWMGKHEVTFSQWDACVAAGGCSYSPGDSGFGRGNRPVIGVSWHDIQEFIAWLNARTGGVYRLPTESEWEYAARAGSESEYTWGDELGVNRANCTGCGSQWDNTETAPVGSFPANVWGLHDVHGNVWEWTEDCVNYDGYEGAPSDGSAWSSGACSSRMVRGGSWRGSFSSSPRQLRSSNRANLGRSARSDNLGFRLARIDVARVVAELEEEMVEIPGGTSIMGDFRGEGYDANERPVHRVTMPSFWMMGKHEVTFLQWDACVADGGCSYSPGDSGFGRGNRPVINISWDDVQEFIVWLNERTDGGYRLPSESEWEYAARAGSLTGSPALYSWGSDIGVNRANCLESLCGDQWVRTAPVGSFPANAWGLHDMHGNVWEWVEDCWNGNYEGAPGDGSAWLSGSCGQRVRRGGSWNDFPRFLRSSHRSWSYRSLHNFSLGFRLARDR